MIDVIRGLGYDLSAFPKGCLKKARADEFDDDFWATCAQQEAIKNASELELWRAKDMEFTRSRQ